MAGTLEIVDSVIIEGSISDAHPEGVIAYDVAAIKAHNKEVGIDAVASMFACLLMSYMILVWKRPEPMKWWMFVIEGPLWAGLIGIGLIRLFG